MPELPEVEVIRLTLEPLVLGRRVRDVEVRCASLRREIAGNFAARLSGRGVTAIRRRSKYLLFDLDDGYCWIVHFGMSGRLVHAANGGRRAGRHDHVIVTLSDGSGLVFNDPRRFGLMMLEREEHCVLLQGLGPEVLDE
ncbi:MAG: DNA-formamidopyrimidine glycosylase family protein, partial [Candidatus Binatia bacterium]